MHGWFWVGFSLISFDLVEGSDWNLEGLLRNSAQIESVVTFGSIIHSTENIGVQTLKIVFLEKCKMAYVTR